jgi:helix-turn-helix protein
MGNRSRAWCDMPWNDTKPMNERVKFIVRCLEKDEPFGAPCAHTGVSRKTGYKWVERYEAGAVAALIDRSRALQPHPHAVTAEIVEPILAARQRHIILRSRAASAACVERSAWPRSCLRWWQAAPEPEDVLLS